MGTELERLNKKYGKYPFTSKNLVKNRSAKEKWELKTLSFLRQNEGLAKQQDKINIKKSKLNRIGKYNKYFEL